MMKHLCLAVVGVALLVPSLRAGEDGLMHCFAFTALDDAEEADWKAWYEATDALPDKINGLEKVWYGKLKRPLRQYNREGKENYRQWAACMLFKDQAALERYAENEAHDDWAENYSKVRVPGTTTYDILAQ